MDDMPIASASGHGFADAAAYLALGDIRAGLEALERDLAAGSRADRCWLRVDPVFEPLWELPEFQAMMADVGAEMAGQLANLREMERAGKLAAIPRG